ncbi:macro domain-containing protein PG1779-like [Choristoneura fumiferana]|uniref:macro domain-containing protein PG1779-like n=1 Tax=Choristoneura fumiferana TaxID=7141 RepID=UPI003D15E2B9
MSSPVYRALFRGIRPTSQIRPYIQFKNHRSYSLKNMTSPAKWKIEKNKLLNMPIEERRKVYRSSDYVTVNKVEPWNKYVINNKGIEAKKHTLEDLEVFKKIKIIPELNKDLSEKVSIFKGDITKLEVDAIVNAANSLLKAGGGVDGAIHRAAGPLLQQENNTLGGCPTGDAKVTGGYDLPARYVIHTVGPQNGSAPALRSCYEKCLSYHQEYRIKSIAFPCISTGIYGFPNRLAAHIALQTARKFLENNPEMERIIFCTFLPIDVDIYETLMQMYFPVHEWNYNDGASVSE